MADYQTKINKLKVLENIAKKESDIQLQNLLKIKHEYQKAIDKLSMLENYLQEYKYSMINKCKKGVNAQTVKQLQSFLQNLTLTVGNQKQLVYKLNIELKEQSSHYAKSLSKRDSIAKILSKRIAIENKILEKKELKELEDQIARLGTNKH